MTIEERATAILNRYRKYIGIQFMNMLGGAGYFPPEAHDTPYPWLCAVHHLNEAIQTERERCAKIAEEYYRKHDFICGDEIAKAIRNERVE